MITHHLADFRQPQDPTDDWTPVLRRFLEAHPGGDFELRLPGGRMDCYPDLAPERQVFPANSDSGAASIPLLLEDLTNVVIDGQGAHLVMRGSPSLGRGGLGLLDAPMLPIAARRCHTLTLRNLTIDWATPYAVQGTVLEVDQTGVLLEMQCPQRWWCWNGRLFVENEGVTLAVQRVLVVDPATGAHQPGSGDNCGNGFEYLWRFEPGATSGSVRLCGALPVPPTVGMVVVCWLAGFDTAGRRSTGIFAEHCHDLSLDHIAIRHAWGMGVLTQCCTDVSLRHLTIAPEPGSGRCFATTGDAVHAVCTRGHLLIEDCRLALQFDDCINVHGVYHRVLQRVNYHTIRVRAAYAQHHGLDPFAPGHRLAITRGPTMKAQGEVTLVAVRWLNHSCAELTCAEDLPTGIVAGDLVQDLFWTCDLSVRRCDLGGNRSRGVLVGAQGMVRIEDNLFHDLPGTAIRFELDTGTYCEAGPFTEVHIDNNRFERCLNSPGTGVAGFGQALIETALSITDPDAEDQPYIYGMLTLTSNVAHHCPAPIVHAILTQAVTSVGNSWDDEGPQRMRCIRCGTLLSVPR